MKKWAYKKMSIAVYSLLGLCLLCSCSDQGSNPTHLLDLNNINNKNSIIELFGENLISTDLYERDMAISNDGLEIIYTLGDYKQSLRCLVSLQNKNGSWSKPAILPFTGSNNDIEPFFSPDGDKLYFASDRPINESDITSDYNIWYSNKVEGDWSIPIPMDTVINKSGDEYYPSLGNSGNIYFTSSRQNGIGSEDIFMSKLINGVYQEAKVLDSTINTETYEFNAYINPQEDLLIFSSFGRPDGLGGGDLYISQKDSTGNWLPSKNLGAPINSENLDYCPFIDYNNNMFYFTSDRADTLRNQINSLSSFREYSQRTNNGMGNIYRTTLEQILNE